MPPTPEEILESLSLLTDGQRNLILEMTHKLRIPVERQLLNGSDITVPAFVENFENRLLIHHATNEDKLKKKAFEFAFKRASEAAGKVASIVSSQTNPGADVIVDGIDFSLKTEGSADIRRDRLTISKLMEGRLIRECVTGADFARVSRERVLHHLSQYTRMITLRGFDRPNDNSVFYELLEIPLDVLRACGELRAADFSPRTANGSSSATVCYEGSPAFRLVFDGSVEKITVHNLSRSVCIPHGEWRVPLLL